MGKQGKFRIAVGLLLVVVLVFSLSACKKEEAKPAPAATGGEQEKPKTTTPAPVPSPAAESKAEPKKLTKVIFGQWGESLVNAPRYVAKSKGFFAEEGLDLEWVTLGAGPAFSVVLAGNVPITDNDSNFIIKAIKAGAKPGEVKLVASEVSRMTMDFVVNKATIQKLGLRRDMPIEQRFQALKGMKIGISFAGAATDYYTRWFARKGGLDPDKDITLVAVGGAAAQLSALSSGQTDAFQWTAPLPQQAVAEGLGEIIISSAQGDVPQLSEFPYTGVIVNTKYAEKNPEIVAAVARGVGKGANYIHDNFEDARDILHRDYFSNVDKAIFTKALESIKDAVPRNAAMSEDGFRKLAKVMVETGQTDQEFDPTEGVWWTNKYLQGLK